MICNYGFSQDWVKLFGILYQVDSLSLPLLFGLVGIYPVPFSSVQFSDLVVSDSLQPHESQQARPLCPSPTPRVHSDSRPLSQWCHPAISSSVVPFSSCSESLPSSQSFPMSQLFAWGGQSTGVSALVSTCWVLLCLFILFILLCLGCPFCILAVCGVLFIVEFPHYGWGCISGLSRFLG